MDSNEDQQQPNPEPTLPSAEQMRARRLAKLGGGTSSSNRSSSEDGTEPGPSPKDTTASTPKTTAQPPSTPAATPASTSSLTAAAEPKSSSTVSPVVHSASGSASTVADAAAAEDRIPSSPAAKRPFADIDADVASQAIPAKASVTPATAPAVSAAESFAEWTDYVISSVLHITIDPERTRDRRGNRLVYLESLRKDVQERVGASSGTDDSPLRLTADDVDPAILTACTELDHHKALLGYLLPCYKAVGRLLKSRITSAERLAVLQEIKRLIMSNIIFALSMPEYFGREANPEHDTIVPYLLRGVRADSSHSLDMDFLTDAIERLADDDDGALHGIFSRAMVEISAKLSGMTMNDEYLSYVEALLTYCRFKPLVVLLADLPSFQMAQSPPNIEKFTILGPFFSLSPLQYPVTKTYFGGHYKVDLPRKETVYSALQMTLKTHQSNLHTIAMAFARAGDGPRNKLLDWFAYTMNVNHKRRALQVAAKDVASDGFMMNVTAVLDRMCEPFMEADFSRMERIDVDYLRRKPRVDIHDETKLNADQAQSDAFYATVLPGESKFISELFFLNMASHHYGSGATGIRFKNIDREIKHIEGQLAMLEEEQKKLVARGTAPNQRALALVEQHLKTYRAALDVQVAYKYSLEAVLTDEQMQQRSLMFMRYVSVWLLRVASRSNYTPDKPLELPLSSSEPEAFSCLPEYMLQNVLDHVRFLFRRVPRILPSAVGDEMVALCVTFLESSEYIRNPYLKSSLVSLLFSGTWRMYHLANGVMGDSLSNSKFANKYLLHALMKFYIECESTGAHTQFYDKFNIRYEIFQVIKAVWPNDVYKQQLTQQSRTNRSFFVRFVNLLLNDATYVLDEALSRFPKIHDLQKELQENGGLTPEERQQKEEALQQAEGQAQSYMQLANETVAMMKLFTEALSDAFTMPEIVSRLAGMLDYNLVTLAGPTSRNLKVENAEKYFFNPKVLLPTLVELYLNLGNKTSFVEAVANDGRSYKPEIFDNATRILSTKGLMDPEKLLAWGNLKDRFAALKKQFDQADLDMGEIPADFEDPIMGDLMRDPVVLPSRHIVDRSTITQHLLSDPKDPFTRQPMTEDDVVPATELRERIEAWKAERIAAARTAEAAASTMAENDAMDERND